MMPTDTDRWLKENLETPGGENGDGSLEGL